ncbi:hypothetical protein FEP90_03683 [Burkholderia multivorans]|nr:hypothetical protein [Burkholderia multivorans]MDR8766213.1 hypothetical protein [Burkholderia multivorans]MDR8770000.1 hypothetical protein [Burkholderia multivorans]MDR8792045.1 hypothetical protein [Burkholderia multivorans]MDR8794554.1 hypothetical protein [Burkholderia multivorans]
MHQFYWGWEDVDSVLLQPTKATTKTDEQKPYIH